MLTLNNLISKIQTFQLAHKQLKSFYFNEIAEKENAEDNNLYPMLFASLQPIKISGVSKKTVIRFYIDDKVKKGQRNYQEVLSDCELICLDLLSYFKQTNFTDYLNIETEVTLNDYTEAFDTETTGFYFDVEFEIIFEWDLCNVPLN